MMNLIFSLALILQPSFAAVKPRRTPPFHKVLIVIFENTNYKDAAKQPFMASLAKKGALLKNYHAVTHPSLPNYLALTSGSSWKINSDDDVSLNVRHIGDLLNEAHKSWKVYAEAYPGKSGKCFLGSYAGTYARKHVPLLSYQDVQKTPALCDKIVNANEFARDFKKKALPDFALYIPDLKNDAHNTDVRYADHWFKKTFGPLLTHWPKDELLVFTFDEDGSYNLRTRGYNKSANRVLTVLYGAGVRPGAASRKWYDHYSLLKTVEAALGLKSLGQKDQSARPIDDVWK